MLGARGVDVLAWESFGKEWVTDITKQLKLPDVNVYEAGYGELPNLAQADWTRDVVFTWNGTDLGCSRAERRLDSGHTRGSEHLRCDLCGLRDGCAVAEARCDDVVVAEGARRRGARTA